MVNDFTKRIDLNDFTTHLQEEMVTARGYVR